jgi:copper chaperone CopZ
MKVYLLLACFVFAFAGQAFAGLKWADVGVNGLTCSMCSRSVEMGLRRLDFVDSVVMSLETTEGRIFFKDNTPVNLNDIAKAVVDAGFSVRFVKLQMSFDDIPLNTDGSFVFQGQSFKWVDFQNKFKGPVSLKLVEQNFLPRKEGAEWKKKIIASQSGEKIFHVVQG